MRRLNQIRRGAPALGRIATRFMATENDSLIAYAKGRGVGTILVCVNVDPHSAHEGIAMVPGDLDLPGEFTVRDLITGAVHRWRIGPNYVRLDPAVTPAHVFLVEG